MKRVFFLSMGILALSFSACKKKNPEPEPTPTTEDPTFELQSKPGSYFVYRWYIIDYDGVETETNTYDTIRILGDTTINEKVCIKLKSMSFGSPLGYEYIRKENGNVVNSNNTILFSYTNFSTQFNYVLEEDFEFYTRMYKSSNPTSVPAGNFNTIEARIHFKHPQTGQSINSCNDLEATSSTYYASGIGEIKKSVMLYSEFIQYCKKRERRLVEYYIPD